MQRAPTEPPAEPRTTPLSGRTSDANKRAQQDDSKDETSFLQVPAVRQAVQAGIGVAIAIGVGSLISGQRWYWAVIATFIVGVGVGSRSEALVKALQRLTGTLVGIVVGIFLGSAVQGYTDLALGLTLVFVFFGFYAFQVAYGTMTFCITLMLAVLYGLIGQFQPHLLVLRFEETGAGAAVGVLVTMTLLPIRQNDVFRDAIRAFLDALAHAVDETCKGDAPALNDAIADLQTKTQALRHSIGGAKRGWLSLVPMRYLRTARAAMRCAYLARELAHRGGIGREKTMVITKSIEALRAGFDGGQASAAGSADSVTGQSADDRFLAAIVEAIDRLAQHLSIDNTSPHGARLSS